MNIESEEHGVVSFEQLISNEETVSRLVQGSFVSGENNTGAGLWEAWSAQRRFIADAIDTSGSILDFGCANGFLLKCLQHWSTYKLDPYGLDIDNGVLQEAKKLFPGKPSHFINVDDFESTADFPRVFDFIYWNVWDNYEFDTPAQTKRLQKLLDMTRPGGRTILGFYDTREKNHRKIEDVRSQFDLKDSVVENPNGEESILWFEK